MSARRGSWWGRNPWWIPPHMLGRVPDSVPDAGLRVLGFVSFALFFEHYDTSLLSNALKFIKDDLGIVEAELGYFQMMIRLGALPAFLVIPFVDRLGRRRLFLASLVGMSLGTLLTAFSQSPAQFVACQMLTRTFVLTASAVSVVIVAEELPASARGWGIGMLAAVSAVGHGMGAAVFAAIEQLPYGWRTLYAFGVLPLLLLPLFRRGIRETARFSEHQAASAGGDQRWSASPGPIRAARQVWPWWPQRRRSGTWWSSVSPATSCWSITAGRLTSLPRWWWPPAPSASWETWWPGAWPTRWAAGEWGSCS